jgi:hypothetical protein
MKRLVVLVLAAVIVLGVVAVVLLADVFGGDAQTEQTRRAPASSPLNRSDAAREQELRVVARDARECSALAARLMRQLGRPGERAARTVFLNRCASDDAPPPGDTPNPLLP